MSCECSVSGCYKSNRPENRTTLHRLPFNDPALLRKWLEKIDLKSDPTEESRICSLHFDNDNFFSKGEVKILHPTSIPFGFEEQRRKFSSSDQEIKTEIQDSIEPLAFVDSEFINEEDKIDGFTEFIERLLLSKLSWKGNWSFYEQPDGVCLYRLKRDENFKNVSISFKILINSEMLVSMYQNESEADIKELNWILKNSRLELWSQFYKLADYYQTEPKLQVQSRDPIIYINQALENLENVDGAVIDDLIEPIKNQLVMIATEMDKMSKDFVEKNSFDVNLYPELKYSIELSEDSRELKNEMLEASRRSGTRRRTNCNAPKKRYDEDIFKCSRCDKFFVTAEEFRKHQQTHDRLLTYCCDICGKDMKGKKSLQNHMFKHGGKQNRIACTQCGILMFPESMKRHVKNTHEGYKPFVCSICGKCFAKAYTLKMHEKTHDISGRESLKKERERYYQKRSTGSAVNHEKTYLECPKCSKKLERGGKTFESHVENCSGVLEIKGTYKYQCFVCLKNFATRIACADHLSSHHNYHINNVKIFCFICKEEFEDIQMHVRSHNCPFQCSICSLQFITQDKLDSHIRDRHKDGQNRPFSCDLCSATFRSKNHLRSHKTLIHSTAERNFSCEVCEKRFAYNYQLTSHVKATHSDEKRFSCNSCEMKFKKGDHLKRHYRKIHGEEFAYPCSECPYKIKSLNELKKHLQEQHGISMNPQKYFDG